MVGPRTQLGAYFMNWYLFEDDLVGCHVYSTVDGSGKAVFAEKVAAPPPTGCFVDVAKSGKMADRLYSVGAELVVSDRLNAILGASTVCRGIHQIAAQVRTAKRRIIGTYYVWYAEEEIDVLDHGSANVRYVNGHVLTVREWVLSATSIPECDLLQAVPGRWMINQTLLDKMKDEDITGCRFTRLAITGTSNRRLRL